MRVQKGFLLLFSDVIAGEWGRLLWVSDQVYLFIYFMFIIFLNKKTKQSQTSFTSQDNKLTEHGGGVQIHNIQ